MNKITITNNLKVSSTVSSTEPFELLDNVIPQETLDILNVSLDDDDLIQNIREMWPNDTSEMSDVDITNWVNSLRSDHTFKSLKVDKAGVLDFKFIQDQHKELTDDELFDLASKTIPINTVSVQYPVEELKTKINNVFDWVDNSDLPSDIKQIYKEFGNINIKTFADNGVIKILDNKVVEEECARIRKGDSLFVLHFLDNMSEFRNTNDLLWNIMLYKMIRHTDGSLRPLERNEKGELPELGKGELHGLGFLLYLPLIDGNTFAGMGLDKKSFSSYIDTGLFMETNYQVITDQYLHEFLYSYNFIPSFVTYVTYQSSSDVETRKKPEQEPEVPKLSVLFFSAEVDDLIIDDKES